MRNILALTLALALALALALVTLASATSYSLTVFAPDTVIDGAQLQAAGNAFYTGMSNPATYCPTQVVVNCPPIEGTLVYAGLSAMAVEVPGGQQVYVNPSGAVMYTQAHSAYMPQGSFVGGWFNKTVVSACAPILEVLDFLATDGSNAAGVMLCPGTQDFLEGTGASYQLYAMTPSFNATNCVQAIGLIQHGNAADFGCWQYI
ncbi:hypothetical protein BJ170DRAFT_690178 [Xylariales sp. AK1849]|nr:hypothetical protein BJ170DRAFT_690178 [Xylariales sp. AK1849]